MYGSAKKLPEHHQKVFGVFLSMESQHMEFNNICKVNQLISVVSAESFKCLFSKTSFYMCLFQQTVSLQVCFS